MKALTVFCLTLALFPRCFGLEGSCACGVACEDDQGTADCITENTFTITDEIIDFNKEVCVEYKVRYKKKLDIYLCKFPKEFQFQDYCVTANDSTLVCNIQSPNFNEINQCYPEQTFCAHSVNCPSGTMLLFHHSEMKLTANVGTSPSECTDFVKVHKTTSIVYTRCGNETVDYFESTHPLLVTSSSSQCCQSYGYFMWANCVPTDLSAGKRDVSTEQQAYLHEKFYEEWKKEVELGLLKVLHVDSESVVKCGKYMVSVVKRDEIIEQFNNIEVIMVYAETTDHETYLDLSTQAGTFVGKGILYIGEEMAMFLQQVIPAEISTNEQEKAYIQRSLDFLVPFFIRQNRPQIQGFPEDFTVCRFEEIFNPLLKNVEFNSTSPFPLIEFPTLLERNQALAEARNNSGSANPFVRSTANLVIQTLSRPGES